MAEILSLMFTLLVVKEIQKTDAGAVIVFEQGRRGVLRSGTKDYDYYLELAQESLEHKRPVGVSLDRSSGIPEISAADNDIVEGIREEDSGRVRVWFQGHDGTFFLNRDHPEFARVRKVLEASLREGKRVWFVERLPRLLIEDAFLEMEGEKATP